MSTSIRFETPENIEVAYQPAGLGTRFVAMFVDYIIIFLFGFFIVFFLALAGVGLDRVLKQSIDFDPEQSPENVPIYFIGIISFVISLGSFFYFGLSELLLRGQTIGKRSVDIRVVKLDGFALDSISILIRNIFRVVDNLPVLWIVPIVSKRSQRLGDMVGGTVVIKDKPQEISNLRVVLTQRNPIESKFRFDAAILAKARPVDIAAVERILERWGDLGEMQQIDLLLKIVPPLAERLQLPQPDQNDALRFLEDFLAAEYRRQYRKLG